MYYLESTEEAFNSPMRASESLPPAVSAFALNVAPLPHRRNFPSFTLPLSLVALSSQNATCWATRIMSERMEMFTDRVAVIENRFKMQKWPAGNHTAMSIWVMHQQKRCRLERFTECGALGITECSSHSVHCTTEFVLPSPEVSATSRIPLNCFPALQVYWRAARIYASGPIADSLPGIKHDY